MRLAHGTHAANPLDIPCRQDVGAMVGIEVEEMEIVGRGPRQAILQVRPARTRPEAVPQIVAHVCNESTSSANRSSESLQDAGGSAGRTTNLEKPTSMYRRSSSRSPAPPIGTTSAGSRFGRRLAMRSTCAGGIASRAKVR